MPRWISMLISLAATGCAGGDVGIGLVFPKDGSHEATRSIAVTAFEPIVSTGAGHRELVECSMVGVFAPRARVNPDRGDFTRLATLGEIRETHEFPSDDWTIDFAKPQNPWGAVMIFVE